MKYVWTVETGEYSDHRILGFFDSEEAAIDFAKKTKRSDYNGLWVSKNPVNVSMHFLDVGHGEPTKVFERSIGDDE